ncbi:hypothetical protein FACHB389_16385 [Nostoc calcicola FACHB-389]|nr:ATP-binding protein [Nostoc calcicola FACHB-3891]OKH34235.1 hypothetical protein FACHB389_16385 [Nostoc calcicola FACHB-389]
MANLVSRRNPYIIGRPIDDPKLLFGRQDLFHFLEDNLSQGIKVTLLHGQRRIGKSSIIRNIPKSVKLEDFVFIRFNLEDYTRENLCRILADLAQEIIEQLEIDDQKIQLPSIEDLDKDPDIFYSQFLTKILDRLDGKKLVFLLDEFEALSDKYSASLLEKFFNYLHSLIEVEDELFLIIFAGRQSASMPNLLNYFQDASTREIGFLNKDSATQLITQPAQGILEYEPEAIKAIIELSAGHPYFIQVICFAIFVRARELDESHISLEDINNIIDKAIENAEAGLAWFWDGLTIPEKIVFSAIAESQKIAVEKSQTVPENSLKLVNQYGIFKTEALEQAVKELVDYNFLDETGEKIKIELVRLWLLERHPLRQEIKELEKLSEENDDSFEDKKQLASQEKKQNNLTNSYNSLALSPKSYNSQLAVIERPLSLDRENSTTLKAVRFTIQNKKQEIEIPQEEEKYEITSKLEVSSPGKSRLSKSIHFLIIAGLMTISAVVGTGIGHFSTRCLASENKGFGGFCGNNLTNNLSRGDVYDGLRLRTFLNDYCKLGKC